MSTPFMYTFDFLMGMLCRIFYQRARSVGECMRKERMVACRDLRGTSTSRFYC